MYSIKNYAPLIVVMIMLILVSSCDTNDTTADLNTAPEAATYNADVVTDWYSLIKTLTIQTPGYTPPVAARAFGYTGLALYEAVQPGISGRGSLSGKLNELSLSISYDADAAYYWPAVANTTLALMTRYFYASTADERFAAIEDLQARYDARFDAEQPSDMMARSRALAMRTAEAIIDYSTTDGGFEANLNNFPTDYTPPQGEQFWAPTPPLFARALQPYWGLNRPFLTANISEQTLPPLPPAFSAEPNSVFFARAQEVYVTVNNLSPEQRIIAEFWADDPVTTATPPGHSISILNQLLVENNASLATAAEAYARLGIGISDAFISCWKIKYETNYIRPVTYIQRYIDPNWLPVLSTPPFPEYTSGHSVQSGALAVLMTSFFGENYTFTDRTHAIRTDIDGRPRTFANFYAMAEEAAISRLYGGIHYSEAINLGLEQGYAIGQNVVDLDFGN